MYNMYPEAWTANEEAKQPQQPPRRRSRRTHSVQPAVVKRPAGADAPSGAKR